MSRRLRQSSIQSNPSENDADKVNNINSSYIGNKNLSQIQRHDEFAEPLEQMMSAVYIENGIHCDDLEQDAASNGPDEDDIPREEVRPRKRRIKNTSKNALAHEDTENVSTDSDDEDPPESESADKANVDVVNASFPKLSLSILEELAPPIDLCSEHLFALLLEQEAKDTQIALRKHMERPKSIENINDGKDAKPSSLVTPSPEMRDEIGSTQTLVLLEPITYVPKNGGPAETLFKRLMESDNAVQRKSSLTGGNLVSSLNSLSSTAWKKGSWREVDFIEGRTAASLFDIEKRISADAGQTEEQTAASTPTTDVTKKKKHKKSKKKKGAVKASELLKDKDDVGDGEDEDEEENENKANLAAPIPMVEAPALPAGNVHGVTQTSNEETQKPPVKPLDIVSIVDNGFATDPASASKEKSLQPSSGEAQVGDAVKSTPVAVAVVDTAVAAAAAITEASSVSADDDDKRMRTTIVASITAVDEIGDHELAAMVAEMEEKDLEKSKLKDVVEKGGNDDEWTPVRTSRTVKSMATAAVVTASGKAAKHEDNRKRNKQTQHSQQHQQQPRHQHHQQPQHQHQHQQRNNPKAHAEQSNPSSNAKSVSATVSSRSTSSNSASLTPQTQAVGKGPAPQSSVVVNRAAIDLKRIGKPQTMQTKAQTHSEPPQQTKPPQHQHQRQQQQKEEPQQQDQPLPTPAETEIITPEDATVHAAPSTEREEEEVSDSKEESAPVSSTQEQQSATTSQDSAGAIPYPSKIEANLDVLVTSSSATSSDPSSEAVVPPPLSPDPVSSSPSTSVVNDAPSSAPAVTVSATVSTPQDGRENPHDSHCAENNGNENVVAVAVVSMQFGNFSPVEVAIQQTPTNNSSPKVSSTFSTRTPQVSAAMTAVAKPEVVKKAAEHVALQDTMKTERKDVTGAHQQPTVVVNSADATPSTIYSQPPKTEEPKQSSSSETAAPASTDEKSEKPATTSTAPAVVKTPPSTFLEDKKVAAADGNGAGAPPSSASSLPSSSTSSSPSASTLTNSQSSTDPKPIDKVETAPPPLNAAAGTSCTVQDFSRSCRELESSELVAPQVLCRGLVNTGNACYRNAILQSLMSIGPLVSVLSRILEVYPPSSIPAEMPMWAELLSLLQQFQEPDLKASLSTPIPSSSSSTRGAKSGTARSQAKAATGSTSSTSITPDLFMPQLFHNFVRKMVTFRNGSAAGDQFASEHPHSSSAATSNNTTATVPTDSVSVGRGISLAPMTSKHNNSQEDAMEFMTYLLDVLHEEMTGGTDSEGEKQAVEEVQDDVGWATVAKSAKMKSVVDDSSREQALRGNAATLISRIFHGTVRSEVHYATKKMSSATFQRFHCLNLEVNMPAPVTSAAVPAAPAPVSNKGGKKGAGTHKDGRGSAGQSTSATGGAGSNVSSSNSNSGGTITLQMALQAYFREETLGPGIKKQTSLDFLPPVLVLQLNRFAYDFRRNVPIKVDREVEYPLQLVLSPSFLSVDLREKVMGSPRAAGECAGASYSLVSVVRHHGPTANVGHYTALCRDNMGVWREFDDAKVTVITAAQATAATTSVYLLFYARD